MNSKIHCTTPGYYFCYCLGQLTALHNGDGLGGAARGAAQRLDLAHHVLAVHDLAEHHVLAVQPRGGCGGDEELSWQRKKQSNRAHLAGSISYQVT